MCLTPYILPNSVARRYLPMAKAVALVHPSVKSFPFEYLEDGRVSSNIDTVRNELSKDYVVTATNARIPLYITVPCGRCAHCAYTRKREFERRLVIEASVSKHMFFFTLTYDDRHLPPEGLHKPHMAQFLKRFRRRLDILFDGDPRFRFRCVYNGEYGQDERYTMRPHYHGLLFFAHELTKREILDISRVFRDMHYRFSKKFLERYRPNEKSFKIWPYGYRRDFQECNNRMASARYLAKYISKPQLIPAKYTAPMFFETPRRCGLGAFNIDHLVDAIKNSRDGYISLNFDGNCTRIKIPQFVIDKVFPRHKIHKDLRTLSSVAMMCIQRLHALSSKDPFINISLVQSFANSVFLHYDELAFSRDRGRSSFLSKLAAPAIACADRDTCFAFLVEYVNKFGEFNVDELYDKLDARLSYKSIVNINSPTAPSHDSILAKLGAFSRDIQKHIYKHLNISIS